MHRLIAMGALCGLLAAQAAAQPPGPDTAPARARYPQPVLVGALQGREVLEDVPQQRRLGRVAGVTRGQDGRVTILVECCGTLGFGTRQVALPVETVTLLGPFLVARGQDASSISALPTVPAQPAALLPAGATISVGLGRN